MFCRERAAVADREMDIEFARRGAPMEVEIYVRGICWDFNAR